MNVEENISKESSDCRKKSDRMQISKEMQI